MLSTRILSAKLWTRVLSLFLVLMALVVAVSLFAPVVTAGNAVGADRKMAASLDEYFTDLPADFGAISTTGLNSQLTGATPPFLVDVRDAAAWSSGHIGGAVNVPIRTLVDNLDKLPAKDQPIVVYCAVGHNGAQAMMALRLLGYTNVKSLVGGFGAWSTAGLPISK